MTTFIVGAGASVAAPGNLPLFEGIRQKLISDLGLDHVAQAPGADITAKHLAPETFMRCIFEGGLPLEEWLTSTLSRGEPNAVHAVLAGAIEDGHSVWTVNVDELIERAAGDAVRVAAYDDDAPDSQANLLKPHGTVGRGRYIFRSDQVIAPLPRAWTERLLSDCRRRHVVVVGYAGLDIDLRVLLNAALADASKITWFEVIGNRGGLLERIPSLARFDQPFVGGEDPKDLSERFVAWADANHLSGRVTDEQRAGLQLDSMPEIPRMEGNPRFARGQVLERIGERRAARREYVRALLSCDGNRFKPAAKKIQTLDFYGGALWTRPLIAWSSSQLAPWMPSGLRAKADRVHVTLLSSHQGDHPAALRRAARVGNPDDPAILIAQAKGARFTGDIATALEKADRCEALARESGSVDELAHALFEQTFCYTWAGDFERAHQLLRELFSGVDSLAGVRWIAWALWQHACLAIYENRPKVAQDDLAQAYALFGSDQLLAGQVAVLTVRLDLARLIDDEALYDQSTELLGRLKGSLGWTSYTETSICLERAEWLRVHGDERHARILNDQALAGSPDYPLHLALALLQRAELERSAGKDNGATGGEIQALLDSFPMAYISTHLAIMEFLAGRLDNHQALSRVASSCPNLATRSGKPASSPLDYCLGMHPDRHEIFLP